MLRWLIAILGAYIGIGNFLLIAIIVFLLLAALGGSTDAWLMLGLMALTAIATVIYYNYQSNKEIKRLRGELEEDTDKNLGIYAFFGIVIVIAIGAFCIISGQQHETSMTRPSRTPEEIRISDSLRQAYSRERDSIEKAQKKAHEEYIRKMARDIVNSGNSSSRGDNMRGWDPASEDDMGSNGMDRYSNANDDEGWN